MENKEIRKSAPPSPKEFVFPMASPRAAGGNSHREGTSRGSGGGCGGKGGSEHFLNSLIV